MTSLRHPMATAELGFQGKIASISIREGYIIIAVE
jgi:hypothetical protein